MNGLVVLVMELPHSMVVRCDVEVSSFTNAVWASSAHNSSSVLVLALAFLAAMRCNEAVGML